MAKIVITLEDNEEGSTDFKLQTDTPFPGPEDTEATITNAQYVALIGSNAMIEAFDSFKEVD